MPSQLRPHDPQRLGPYALTELLGEGGQGTVYLGAAASGARVAVKLLHAELADDPSARARFVREVATAERVSGAFTARVLDADVAGDRPYVVSEYVEGPALQERVTTRGPLDPESLERLATGTATALAAIHAEGVVHRDFKPGNVLMADDGPRVIDFGIARVLDMTATLSSSVLGTPSYMAPEQFVPTDDRPPGKPADIFAWAATIAYACTGRAPFGSDDIPRIMHRILYADPDLDGVPDGLRRLLERCLAKHPAVRPTAAEVLARLRNEELPPKRRRRQTLAVGLSLALTAVAVGVVATVAWTNQDRDGTPEGRSGSRSAKQTTEPPARENRARPGTALAAGAKLVAPLDGPTNLVGYVDDGKRFIWSKADQRYVNHVGDSSQVHTFYSPDGNRIAGHASYVDLEKQPYITLTDRRDGSSVRIEPVPGYEGAYLFDPAWSPDGRQLLIGFAYKEDGESYVSYTGFQLVDVETLTSRYITQPGILWMRWLPDGSGFVGNPAPTTNDLLPDVQFFDRDLKETTLIRDAGYFGSDGFGPVSPDGSTLVTNCAESKAETTACVWDIRTLTKVKQIAVTDKSADSEFAAFGWYDEEHLLVEGWVRNQVWGTLTVNVASEVAKPLVENPQNIGLEFARDNS